MCVKIFTQTASGNLDAISIIQSLPIKQQYLLLAILLLHLHSTQTNRVFFTVNEALRKFKEILKEAKLFDVIVLAIICIIVAIAIVGAIVAFYFYRRKKLEANPRLQEEDNYENL